MKIPRISIYAFNLIFILIAHNTFGEAIKFGKVPDDLVKMTTYNADPEAEAVVLSHWGEAKYEYNEDKGFVIVYKIHKVVKILKKSGLEYAAFSISYYTFFNTIDDIATVKGNVYNAEGGDIVKEKLAKEHIFDEKVSATYSLRKVAMPNVKEGSVVEIYYEITSDLHHYFREWEFQTSIPTKWSEYLIEFPQYFNYSQTNQGAHPYVINNVKSGFKTKTLTTSNRNSPSSVASPGAAGPKFTTQNIEFPTTIYHWAVNDAPALRKEAFIDNPMSYATKVEFQLQSVNFPNSVPQIFANGWVSMSKELLKDEDFGKHLEKVEFVNPLIGSIISDASSDMEKVKKIYDHVSSKIKWTGKKSIYPSKALEKIYAEENGNLADINFLLIAFLRAANINAHPLVSISRDRGFINPSNPVMYKLNVVTACVKLNDKDIILDASDQSLPFGFINSNYINFQGWLVAPEPESRWVIAQNSAINSEISIFKLKLEENKIQGNVSHSWLGYDGAAIRNAILREGEEKYKTKVENKMSDWDINNVSWEKIDSRHQNVVEKFELTAKEDIEENNGFIYIQPLENQLYGENPFKEDKRFFPIDFIYPQKKQIMWTLQIPEDYTIEELPKSIATQLPEKGITYSFNIGSNGSNIQIMCTYQVNKTLFGANEYNSIKEFFDVIAQKQDEMIVLKKN